MVIARDLPERHIGALLDQWVNSEVREFKVRIIETKWERFHAFVLTADGPLWSDLDGKRLQFRGNFRPAARYLYFHYCLQVLRRAWKAGPGEKALVCLRDELGKPFWGTPGRYIAKNILQAFIEEIGHEASDLMVGAASWRNGDPKVLTEVMVNQIREGEEESEGDDDNDDSDGE